MFNFLQQPINSNLSPELFWSCNIADLVMGLCYITVAIIFSIFTYRNRKQIPYYGIFIILALYVLTNGIGYFIQIANNYVEIVFLLILWKVFTSIVAVVTALIFVFAIPKIISIRAKEAKVKQEKTKKLFAKQKIIESALIESENKIAAVFHKTSELIFILYPDGRIWEINDAALTLCNLQYKDAKNKHFDKIFSWMTPDTSVQIKNIINKVATGIAIEEEGVVFGKNKQKITIYFSFQPFHTQGQNNFSILIEARDISSHKQIEEELTAHRKHLMEIVEERTATIKKTLDELKEKQVFLRALIDAIPDPIYYKDNEGNYLGYNKAFSEHLEKSNASMFLSINNRKLTPSTSKIISRANRFAASTKDEEQAIQMGIVRKENCYETSDGNIIYFETLKTPYYDDKHSLLGVLSISREITQRKQQEKFLEEITHKAREASIAKGMFLANMSHEIRTPINGIIGFIELLMRTELTVQQYDYVSKLKTSSHSLLSIINDILDFSKIEAQKLTPKYVHFQLNDVMEDIADIFFHTAFDKGIELIIDSHIDFSTFFVGEPMWLRRILVNLVGNAIKFTEKGKIIVIASFDLNINGLKFIVKDSGIGIAPEYMEKLFTPFTQADFSSTRKHGGTGLGLSISKQLVELMGGEISVHSTLGEGTTFIFSLPLKREKSTFETLVRKGKMAGKKALIIDNEEKYAATIKRMMGYFGFRTTCISQFDMTMESKEENYDIVICNGNIGRYRDFEIVDKIKNDTMLSSVPILLLGNFVEQQRIEKLYDMGIRAFLVKPVKVSILFDALNEIFNNIKVKRYGTRKIWIGKSPSILKNSHILLVEDNKLNQQIARELLMSAEIKVSLADNGKEALKLLDEEHFDLVLMDVQMPEMDGYETTQRIRQNKKIAEIPIIAMTAYAMVGDKEKCLIAGMNDYLAKPIEPDTLFSILMRWLKIPQSIIVPTKPKENKDLENFDIPYINVRAGLYRTGNNKEFFLKLLLKYASKYEDIDDKIFEIIKSNDINSFKKLVHEVKGVSANIGAVYVEDTAREIEKNIDNPELQIFIEKFSQSLRQTIQNIRENSKLDRNEEQKKATETTISSNDTEKEVLNSLELNLKKCIPAECINNIEKLRASFPEKQNELEKLETLVKKYKFREARKLYEYVWKNHEKT